MRAVLPWSLFAASLVLNLVFLSGVMVGGGVAVRVGIGVSIGPGVAVNVGTGVVV